MATGFGLAIQPIRPVERAGARFNRLPWFEILMRPNDGRPPDEVVATAYGDGHAVALDTAILRAAAPLLRRHCHYSLNVSVEALGSQAFCTELRERLSATGMLGRLVVEVVGRDTASPEAWSRSVTALETLRADRAIAVALDDLVDDEPAQLALLAGRGLVDYVKFDCAATSRMLLARRLTPAAAMLVVSLGGEPELVAEGVEDAAAFAALTTVSPWPIKYWQGFYDEGRPAPFGPSARASFTPRSTGFALRAAV